MAGMDGSECIDPPAWMKNLLSRISYPPEAQREAIKVLKINYRKIVLMYIAIGYRKCHQLSIME